MADNDDRREHTLPVTGEVGSEGGSFAERTMQVPTFEGDIGRIGGPGGDSSSSTQAMRSGDIPGQETAADGIVRYPTDPPHPPSATEGRRMTVVDWKMGIAGAAAGAAIAIAISRLRSRSGERHLAAGDCDVAVEVTPPLVE